MNAIELSGASLRLGKTQVLREVNLTIPEGNFYGLVGCNGAGKTSLLRILTGLVPLRQGSLKLFGSTDLCGGRRKIGACMEFLKPDSGLCAEQYLGRVCGMLGANTDRVSELLEQVGISGQGGKTVMTMSLGMKRRLMLACALAGHPRLLLLDEPFNGIDPQGVEDISLLLLRLKAQGITFLVASHLLSDLIRLADDFGVMREGNMVYQGSRSDLEKEDARKAVIRTKDPAGLVCELRQSAPGLCCLVSGYEEVSLIGDVEDGLLQRISQKYTFSRPQEKKLTIEEFLRWKMNG